jgi:AcrR family transcriptional regulator
MRSNTSNRVGKQHLLEVAEGLFIEHGYQAVSIRDIARAGGVTNAALYYYFPNKGALFSEVLAYHAEKLRTRLEQAGQVGDSSRDRVAAMLLAYSQHVAQSRSSLFLLRIKMGKIDEQETHRHHLEFVSVMMQPIEDELRIAIESGELMAMPEETSPASLLLGLFHGLVQHRRACRDLEITPQDVNLILDIFWRGMS